MKRIIKNEKASKITAIVIAVLCLVYVALNYFRLQTGLFPLKVTNLDPVVEDCTEDYGVVIDKRATRALFIDGDGKIVNIVYGSSLMRDGRYFYDTDYNNGYIYLHEQTFFEGSDYLSSDSFVEYSSTGARRAVLYERKYEDGECLYSPFYAFQVQNSSNRLLLTEADGDAQEIRILSVPINRGQEETVSEDMVETLRTFPYPDDCCHIYMANYDPRTDSLALIDQRGFMYASTGSSEKPEPIASKPSHDKVIYFDFEEDGTPVPIYEYEHSGEDLPFGTLYALRHLSVYAALLLAVVILLSMLIRSLARRAPEERSAAIMKIVVALIISAGAITAVSIYSNTIINNAIESRTDSFTVMSNDLVTYNRGLLTRALDEYYENEFLSDGTYDEVYNVLKGNSDSGKSLGFDRSPALWARDEHGHVVILCSVSFEDPCGVSYPKYNDLYARLVKEGKPFGTTYEDEYEKLICSFSPVTDDSGRVIGAVTYNMGYSQLYYQLLGFSVRVLIQILSALVVLVFLFVESKEWIRSFSKYRLLKSRNVEKPVYALLRPLFFLEVALTSADSAIIVLIAKDLLGGSAVTDAVMISMPLTMSYIGMFLGSLVAPTLMHRFGGESVVKGASAGLVLAEAGKMLSIIAGNFWMFAVMKLIASATIYSAQQYVMGLKFLAPNESERADMVRSTATVITSASSIAAMISGYISDMFGNQAVYIFTTLLAAGNLILILMVLKGRTAAVENAGSVKQERPNIPALLKFLVSQKMLVVIFCLILLMSFNKAYKGFLFPLIAGNKGMSKASISTIIVFANALVYVLLPKVKPLEKKLGYRRLSCICLVVLAVCYGLAAFDDTLILACIVMLITMMVSKVCLTSWQMLTAQVAKESGFDVKTADWAANVTDSFFSTFSTTALGALLNVGSLFMSLVIAGYSAVSAVILKLTGEKKK